MSQFDIILILTDHFRRDVIGEWTPNLRRLPRREKTVTLRLDSDILDRFNAQRKG